MATANRSHSRYWYRPEVGPQPPFVLIGTNIGLGLDHAAHTWLKGPNGDRYECECIEPILRVIDLIQEPDRTKLLAGAALDYGLPVESLLGPYVPLEPASTSVEEPADELVLQP